VDAHGRIALTPHQPTWGRFNESVLDVFYRLNFKKPVIN
jgi:hypothetical protein